MVLLGAWPKGVMRSPLENGVSSRPWERDMPKGVMRSPFSCAGVHLEIGYGIKGTGSFLRKF